MARTTHMGIPMKSKKEKRVTDRATAKPTFTADIDKFKGIIRAKWYTHILIMLHAIKVQKHLYCLSICYSTSWSGVAGLSTRGGRADKPQHHDKRWNKMFISVDWLFSRARGGFTCVLPNKVMRVNLRTQARYRRSQTDF